MNPFRRSRLFRSALLCGVGSAWAAFACYDPVRLDCTVECSTTGACPDEMHCSNGLCAREGTRCEPSVASGAAAASPCDAGDARCRSRDGVERCSATTRTWQHVATCGGETPICSGATCVACAPGASRCSDGRSKTSCDSTGVWTTQSVPCPDFAPECSASACVPRVDVTAGGAHACARLAGGEVRCWGLNASGQLGAGDTLTRGEKLDTLAPAVVKLAGRAARVSAGGAHSCAVLDSGKVQCWGENGNGQLGLGDRADRADEPAESDGALPVLELGTGAFAIDVSAGSRHTCALLEAGQVKCWGANELGQLGLGDARARGDELGEMGDALASVELGADAWAIAVEAGFDHSCALLADGSVKCWGANEYGQLGVADAPNRSAPPSEPGSEIPRVDLGSGTRARGISAGGNHTCAVLEDGRVACWGGNEAGQLGLGHRIARVDASAEPAEAGLGFGAVALGVSAGAGHTCVLLADLRIKCFGINYHGALGQGLTSDARGDDSDELGDALSAVELGESGESSVGAVALSAGVDFTCAALDSELVKCWGANGSGQLGVGDTRSRGSNASDLGEALPPVALD